MPTTSPLPTPRPLQHVGEALGLVEQLGVGDLAPRVGVLALPVEGDAVAVAGVDVAVEAVGGGVQLAADEPLRERAGRTSRAPGPTARSSRASRPTTPTRSRGRRRRARRPRDRRRWPAPRTRAAAGRSARSRSRTSSSGVSARPSAQPVLRPSAASFASGDDGVLPARPHSYRVGSTVASRLDDLPAWARDLLAGARVARLGLLGDDDRPRVLPVTFAVCGDAIWSAIDDKPKRATPARLRYLRRNPAAALTVDRYADEWSRARLGAGPRRDRDRPTRPSAAALAALEPEVRAVPRRLRRRARCFACGRERRARGGRPTRHPRGLGSDRTRGAQQEACAMSDPNTRSRSRAAGSGDDRAAVRGRRGDVPLLPPPGGREPTSS